eukprot:8776171-Pyramimonas_sp.AAC.1
MASSFYWPQHVDDIRVTGSPQEKAELRQFLEGASGQGELDVSEGTVTCCGARYFPTRIGGYELDRTGGSLKPI